MAARRDATEGGFGGLVRGFIRRVTEGKPEVHDYESTCIDHTVYWPRSGTLAINFVKGRHAYDYFTVDRETYKDLTEAESAGGFFNAELRDQHSIYGGQSHLLKSRKGKRFR